MSQFAGIAAAFVLVLLAAGVFFFALWLLYKLVSWILGLPRAVAQEQALPKFMAAFVALLFARPLVDYIVRVLDSGLRIFPEAIDTLFRAARTIALRCATECSFDAVQSIGSALASIVAALVSSLQLGTFPILSFLVFLLLFSIFYLTYVLVARNRPGQTAGATMAPRAMHFAFFAIVVCAFYLSLSALLALSLMQSAKVPEGFSHVELQSAIDLEIPNDEEFGGQFAPVAVFPGGDAEDRVLDQARRQVAHNLRISAGILAGDWRTASRSARRQLLDLQNRAVESFNSQSTQRLGGRPTIDHFDQLLAWFQRQRRAKEENLSACVRSVNAWIRNAAGLVENWRAVASQSRSPETAPTDDSPFTIEMVLRGELTNTLVACDGAQQATYETVPDRPSRGESLGYVGRVTGWLLDTDSAPLVIIVGLVGFSLLGAAVSRVVRLGQADGLAGLKIGDLMRVVAGGVTAAMLVFLSAYGGLAVLGESEADPNPYVIFAFCLVGAIFSERVWSWAEDVILSRVTGRRTEGSTRRTGRGAQRRGGA